MQLVQCVVVGVTCGARFHIVLRLQCAYDWREAGIYREWCAIAHGQSDSVNEQRGSVYIYMCCAQPDFLYTLI